MRILLVLLIGFQLCISCRFAEGAIPRFGPTRTFKQRISNFRHDCVSWIIFSFPSKWFSVDRQMLTDWIAYDPLEGQTVLYFKDDEWEDMSFLFKEIRDRKTLVSWIRSYVGPRKQFKAEIEWFADLISTKDPRAHLLSLLKLKGFENVSKKWAKLEKDGWKILPVAWLNNSGIPWKISYRSKTITLAMTPGAYSYPGLLAEIIAGVFIDDLVQNNQSAVEEYVKNVLAETINKLDHKSQSDFISRVIHMWMDYSAQVISLLAYGELVENKAPFQSDLWHSRGSRLIFGSRDMFFSFLSIPALREPIRALRGINAVIGPQIVQLLGTDTIIEYLEKS